MKKNTYITLLVIVVLGIIFWVFLASKNVKTPETSPVTVSTQSITNATSPASAVLAGAKIISWQTDKYPASVGVNINLIKKVSAVEFTLVRTLATDTPNDGEDLWIPQNGENTDDLYIQVTCSNSYQFQAGCSLASDPIKVN